MLVNLMSVLYTSFTAGKARTTTKTHCILKCSPKHNPLHYTTLTYPSKELKHFMHVNVYSSMLFAMSYFNI